MRMEKLLLKKKVLLCALFTSLGITGCGKNTDLTDVYSDICTNFGPESKEAMLIEYIMLDSELYELNGGDNKGFSDVKLDSPEEIKKMIDDYKKEKNEFNEEYLNEQECAINYYLATEGYKIASNDSLDSLKGYANAIYEKSDDAKVYIKYSKDKEVSDFVVSYPTETYYLKYNRSTDKIRESLEEMYLEVGNLHYSEDRNEEIINGLISSIELDDKTCEIIRRRKK